VSKKPRLAASASSRFGCGAFARHYGVTLLPALDDIELIMANGCVRTTDFVERCAAAVAGGFHAIGWSGRDYGRCLEDGWTAPGLAAVVADHGLRLTEIETIAGFADRSLGDDPARARHATREGRERMFAMAGVFGARHVQAVGSFVGPLEPDVVESFAALCDEAAQHGLLVALEFVPCTNIPDAANALRIVTEADRPNGGLCVDIWHHERGARDFTMLAAIPPERVVMIQLDDGPAVPVDDDFVFDTMHFRDLPGEGSFDTNAFLGTLWSAGARAPLSIEVMDDRMYALPAVEAARRIGEATRAALVAALEQCAT
jgi:sugar phosphate isomerase/epimerase